MIIELSNILSKEDCEEIIRFYEDNPQLRTKNDAQERFNNCSMSTNGLGLRKITALTTRLIIKAAKFYHAEEMYLDYQSITKWERGQDMVFHADNVTEKKEPHWYCHWRDYSSILYLNDNYEGGETVFKFQKQIQTPVQGTAILFPASYGYTHGVKKVESGERYTIASWFTMDEDHCVI